MRDLRIEGWSADKRFLVARDAEAGEKFRIPADDRLAALVNLMPSSRTSDDTTGQLEIRMESSLSPRDIQTRIRRGESPQSVADSAGVPLDRISPFAGPVLAERAFMCEQARKTTIRRKHVNATGVLTGPLVDEGLLAAGVVPEDATWDAWRREDGRWTVTVSGAEMDQIATFTFDAKSRYVVPDDTAARELVGDVALPNSPDMAIADALAGAGRTPVEAVVAEPAAPVLTAEQIAAHIVEPTEAPEHPVGVSSLKAARDRRAMEQLAITEPDPAPAPAEPEAVDESFEETIETNVAVPDTVAPRKKRAERRRVPSWDEIMFGDKND